MDFRTIGLSLIICSGLALFDISVYTVGSLEQSPSPVTSFMVPVTAGPCLTHDMLPITVAGVGGSVAQVPPVSEWLVPRPACGQTCTAH